MGLKKTITGEKENAEAGAWENQQPQRCEEEGAWENIIQYTIVKEKDSLTSKTIKKTKRHQQQQKENPPPATTDHHQNRRKKKRHRIKGRRSTYRRKGTGEKEEEEAHMKEKKWRGRGNGRRKWIVTHTNESLRPFIRKGEGHFSSFTHVVGCSKHQWPFFWHFKKKPFNIFHFLKRVIWNQLSF